MWTANILLQREIIAGLAIAGALLSVAASLAFGRNDFGRPRLARWAVGVGYALSGVSLLLFIVAGFVALR